jgi:hypothetical protein
MGMYARARVSGSSAIAQDGDLRSRASLRICLCPFRVSTNTHFRLDRGFPACGPGAEFAIVFGMLDLSAQMTDYISKVFAAVLVCSTTKPDSG